MMLELENAYEWESDLEDYGFDEEFEDEDFLEGEYEGDYEGEEFLGRLFKKAKSRIRSIARRAAPVLRAIAPRAIRAVGTAVGIPPSITSALGGWLAREDELDYELEGELDYELDGESDYELDGESDYEYEMEDESESEFELMMADVYSDLAAKARSGAEAEALTGAAIANVLRKKSPSVQKVSPKIVVGGAALAKELRRFPQTRRISTPVANLVAHRASKNLAKKAAQGKKITTKDAAKTMVKETKKVLSSPMTCAKAAVKASQAKKKVIGKLRKPAKYY